MRNVPETLKLLVLQDTILSMFRTVLVETGRPLAAMIQGQRGKSLYNVRSPCQWSQGRHRMDWGRFAEIRLVC
jgi:hypothetical protein